MNLDANWGNSPDNARSTPLYIVTLTNAPIIFNVGLQGLAAQSTMDAELTAAAPTMKGTVFCSNMMLELGFDESFDSVPLHIDNTSALHVAGNRTYSLHAKYIALRCTRTYSPRSNHIALRYYFFVQELVEGGKVSIHYVKSMDHLSDLGTKHRSKHRNYNVIRFIEEFKA